MEHSSCLDSDIPLQSGADDPLLHSQEADANLKTSRDLVEQIEEVIEQMDKSVNKYYYLARETVPDLVATESDPQKFIMMGKGDIAKAAERLANYWLNRNYFFGDRWLLPMSQSGRGSLSREDIEILRWGCWSIITLPDKRQVFLTDPSRIQRPIGLCVRERILFYLLTMELTDVSHKEGVDAVFVMSSAGVASTDRAIEHCTRVLSSLPVIGKSLVIVAFSFSDGRESLRDFFTFAVLRLHQSVYPGILATTTDSAEQALSLLEAKGIKRTFLPKKIGGFANFDDQFAEWVRMRLSLENALNSTHPYAMSKPDRRDKGLTKMIRRAARDNPSAEEDLIRKRNAVYARRKAHKAKVQKFALEYQKESLESENQRLREDNERLDFLLSMAMREVNSGCCLANDVLPPGSIVLTGAAVLSNHQT